MQLVNKDISIPLWKNTKDGQIAKNYKGIFYNTLSIPLILTIRINDTIRFHSEPFLRAIVNVTWYSNKELRIVHFHE